MSKSSRFSISAFGQDSRISTYSVVEIDSIELNHQTKKKIQNLIKKEKENRSYACMLMLMIVEISNQTSSCDGGELLIEGFSTGFPSSTVSGTETSKTNE